MNVVVTIDGREAIPIRAIPLVTGRWVSPDVLAESLAYHDEFNLFNGIFAYQLLANGEYSKVLPGEWDVVEDHLQGLDRRLAVNSDDKKLTRPIWIIESTKLLPAGVFLWRDEFERAFCRKYSPRHFLLIDARHGDLTLKYSPLIPPPETRENIMEGFEGIPLAVASHGLVGDEPKIECDNGKDTNLSNQDETAPIPDILEPEICKTQPTVSSGTTRNVHEKLEQILTALKQYADEHEQPFDSFSMPGPLGNSPTDQGSFHWLCAQIDRIFSKAQSTFKKYRKGICAVAPRAKPTDFYQSALPHIRPKLSAKDKKFKTKKQYKYQ